jgi:DNA mismatch endonuclease (patch repair protein)
MSANRGKNTGPELSLRKALWGKGVRGYRIHLDGLPGRPDVVFPKKRLAIMINGCFWHRCPLCRPSVPKTNSTFWKSKFERNVERDAMVLEELEALGWRTMVVWECSIKSNVDEVVMRIRNELRMP